MSSSLKARACWRASSSVSSSKTSGMLKARMIVRVSTPGWPLGPRISVRTPTPCDSGVGYRTISSATLSPGFAPLAPGSPTEMGAWKVVPSTLTIAGAPVLEVSPDEQGRAARDDLDDPPFEVEAGVVRLLGDLHRHLVAAGGIEPGVRAGCRCRPSDPSSSAGGRSRTPWTCGGYVPTISPLGSTSGLARVLPRPSSSLPSRMRDLTVERKSPYSSGPIANRRDIALRVIGV